MKIVGKVLWWDSKYKRGIIIDDSDNEYYFDASLVDGPIEKIRSKSLVIFEREIGPDKSLSAKAVQVSSPARRQRTNDRSRKIQIEI